MYMPLSKRHIHRYLVQGLIFIFIFYYCLLYLARSPKNANVNAIDKDLLLKDSGPTRLKGKPFEPQSFKLKVDFSSEEAGAKIVAQSKSLLHVKSIQNNDRNSYLLAPCRKTDWIIISFPESISVKHIAFVSYEYYASTYKVIRISASPVYPSAKWRMLAEVETERGQSEVFDIASVCDMDDNNGCWAKYLKLEFLDFHNFEENYYCSLTSMKVYGSTAVDVLESEITNYDTLLLKGNNISDEFNFSPKYKPQSSDSLKVETVLEDPRKETSMKRAIVPVNEKETHVGSIINAPNSGDYLNAAVHHTVLRFMTQLAARSDKHGVNRYLYAPLMRFIRRKQCCVRSLMSLVKDDKHLGDYIPGSSRRCWNMLLGVNLPTNHTWFEGMVHSMLKEGLMSSSGDMFSTGGMNYPLLLCVKRAGFFSEFACYSRFVYTSFATFTSTKIAKGLVSNPRSDLPLTRFYFFHNGSISQKAVHVSRKRISEVFMQDRLVRGEHFIVSDGYISSITLSTDTCTLTMKHHMVEDMRNGHQIIDLAAKSYVNITGKTITRVTKDLGILMLLVDSLNKGAIAQMLNKGNVMVSESATPQFKIDDTNSGDRITENKQTVVNPDEEPSGQFKKTQGHKHVLLQLSERVKALESFVNQLNRKVNEINDHLTAYVDHMHHLKNLQKTTSPMHHISKWRKTVQDEVQPVLKALGIQRLSIFFLHAMPNMDILNRKCVKGGSSSRFPSCTCLLKMEEEPAKDIRRNSCHINNVRLTKKGRKCDSFMLLSRISIFIRGLKRYKLLDCCRKYGCECMDTVVKEASHLLWMPHFSKASRKCSKYYVLEHIYYWIEACQRCILNLSYAAFGTLSRIVFNVYTMSVCIFCTQIFWFYRDRANRMLIYDIYERIPREQGTKN
ncbi:hypothetical protein X943_001431 [Babesia divergens]|uniref:SUN domain-containing protein n=1 Tax=Babesia divergens TaxID=32595 RepID=A0AAD9GK42_BABDI|nr:hypothetical protein X943_001431 [Babesia divergens]